MTTTSPNNPVLETASALAQSIQASAEWREFMDAQTTARANSPFNRMIARQSELTHLQNAAHGRGEGLDGKLLVELIALREQVQHHELYTRQRRAWSALVKLLQRINNKISQELGFNFASNATPHRDGCCG